MGDVGRIFDKYTERTTLSRLKNKILQNYIILPRISERLVRFAAPQHQTFDIYRYSKSLRWVWLAV
jgi:hypothetical protein